MLTSCDLEKDRKNSKKSLLISLSLFIVCCVCHLCKTATELIPRFKQLHLIIPPLFIYTCDFEILYLLLLPASCMLIISYYIDSKEVTSPVD